MPEPDPSTDPSALDFKTLVPPTSRPQQLASQGSDPARRDTDRESWLSALLEDHRRRWEKGDPISVETFLKECPELAQDEEALLDLIYQEVLQREEHGETPDLTEYLERFPSLRDPLERQFSVQLALHAESVLGDVGGKEERSRPQPSAPTPAPNDVPSDPYATASFAVIPVVQVDQAADPFATVDFVPAPSVPVQAAQYPKVPGYDILGVLGKGGMGVVYKARHEGLNRLVALKMIRDASLAGHDDLARFQGEARTLATFQHPNIVQVFDVGTADGLPYFSLEFVDGGSLDRQLKRTPQPPLWCAKTLEVIARAVAAAHARNIIHRDLKPANVLMTRDSTLKITDFGLAKQLDAAGEQTHSGAIMGTPNYMAPEQTRGDKTEIGPLSDVYSLGVILYEMLTGRLPLVGETLMDTFIMVRTTDPVPPRQLQPKVPPDLETICLKCLRKEPGKRYACADDLAEDLRRWQNGEPILARPVPLRERFAKWVRRHPTLAALYGVGAALVLVLIGSLFIYGQLETQRANNAQTELEKLQGQEETRNKLLPPALAAMQSKEWSEARTALEKALVRIQDNAGAAPLREEIAAYLVKARKGENHLEELGRFNREFDEAVFLEPRIASDPEAIAKARTVVESALKRYGVIQDITRPVPVVPVDYLKSEQQRTLQTRTWHLVFILSEIEATPPAGGDPQAGTTRALTLLDGLARVSPATQSLHNQRGLYLDQLGRKAEARAARKLAPEEPVDAMDYLRRGTLRLVANEREKAAADFQEVLRHDHNSFWALYWLALCEMQAATAEPRTAQALTLLAAAEAQLNLCVEQRQDFAWAYILRANARAEQGKRLAQAKYWQRARQDFLAAEKYSLDDEARYGLLVGRGALSLMEGQFAAAEKDLVEARQLRPRSAQSYLLLAQVYGIQKRPEQALAQLDAAIQHNPAQASLHRTRALVRQEMGKEHVAGALQDFERAIALAKAQPEPGIELAVLHMERGELLRQQQDFTSALAAFDAAVEARSDLAQAYLRRSEALSELADREPDPEAKRRGYLKSLRSVNEFVRRARPEAKDYSYRAAIRSQLALSLYTTGGSPEQVVQNQREALELYQGAVEDYSRALDLLPDSERAEMYSRRGWNLLLMMDAPKLALPDFRRVVDKAPRDPASFAAAYTGRGLCLAQLGSWSEAVMDGEKALEQMAKAKPTTFLMYNVARIHALASGRLAELPGADAKQRALRVQYQDRSVELIRQGLELLPPAQRPTFWRESVRSDPALVAIRSSATYKALVQQYEKKGPGKE